MNAELKNKILYSNIVTNAILTNKVIGIYLGGSRVLSLESSESDYDIIMITKDESLQYLHGERLNIPNHKVHLQINNIRESISTIKNPLKVTSFNRSKLISDLISLQDIDIIYSTTDLVYLKTIFTKYKKELYTLSIENCLNNLTRRFYYPITSYKKIHYHYLTQYFLLQNFITYNTISLTNKQIETLKDMKLSRKLPDIFFESLKCWKSNKWYTSHYDYKAIYEEVKQYG